MNSFTQGLTLASLQQAFPSLIPILIWVVFWKGLALWHSARRGEAWWFIALLLINTIGILELIYLFFVIKRRPENLFSKK